MMNCQIQRLGLKPGDLLLFSGHRVLSEGIKWFTLSHWSHVALITGDRPVPCQVEDLFCWESNRVPLGEDLDTQQQVAGVQRLPLLGRLRGAWARGDEVWVRQLNVPLQPAMLQALLQLQQDLAGRAYEHDQAQLLRAAYDGWGGQNQEDLSSVFCSELVAAAYQRMQLLDAAWPSNEYTPHDFSTARLQQLAQGYGLGPEIQLCPDLGSASGSEGGA